MAGGSPRGCSVFLRGFGCRPGPSDQGRRALLYDHLPKILAERIPGPRPFGSKFRSRMVRIRPASILDHFPAFWKTIAKPAPSTCRRWTGCKICANGSGERTAWTRPSSLPHPRPCWNCSNAACRSCWRCLRWTPATAHADRRRWRSRAEARSGYSTEATAGPMKHRSRFSPGALCITGSRGMLLPPKSELTRFKGIECRDRGPYDRLHEVQARHSSTRSITRRCCVRRDESCGHGPSVDATRPVRHRPVRRESTALHAPCDRFACRVVSRR